MILRPPISTRTYTLLPYTSLFLSRIATFFKSVVLNIRQQCRQNKIGEDANLPVDMVRRHLANAHAIQHGRRGEIESHPLHKHSHQCRGRYGMHGRSEEHTSELQSLMRISYAVFCLKKKTQRILIIKNTLSIR